MSLLAKKHNEFDSDPPKLVLNSCDILLFKGLSTGVCLNINSPYPRIFVIYTELPRPNTTADIIRTSKPKSSLLNGLLAFFHSPALYAQ